jgi:hypothetical protein
VFFVVLSYFVIVGASNAVNLTDGLDGLAILPTVLVGTALGLIAYLTGNINFADYLQIPYVAGSGELSVFCGAHRRRRARVSCGSTPIRRRCSWAMWAPWPSVRLSARSR